jgi:hypothetical protein
LLFLFFFLSKRYVLTEVLKGVNDTALISDALQTFYRKRIVRTSIVQVRRGSMIHIVQGGWAEKEGKACMLWGCYFMVVFCGCVPRWGMCVSFSTFSLKSLLLQFLGVLHGFVSLSSPSF